MQSAKVVRNSIEVGFLSKEDDGKYIFVYTSEYIQNPNTYPISVNFPKQSEPFISDYLFSFFTSLLSEGSMKEMQCRSLKIDENDDFSRLLKTATKDTIGSIIIEEIKSI